MSQNPLVLFDGVCNLCNGTVDFILKRDKKKQFRFVSLQTEAGKAVREKLSIPEDVDSVVFIFKGKIFFESEAALEIARLLPFPWRLALVFKIIPLNLRNRIYRWIARNRYGWFGKKAECRIPTPEERRFFPDVEELDL